MKKDFIQDILINLLAKRKERVKDDKVMKKNYENLSLVERNAYEEIVRRKDSSHFYIFTAPFYAVFYLGLFGLVMKYAFSMDILILLKTPVILILGFIPIFFLAWMFFLLINLIELNHLKRDILLKNKCG